MRVKISIIVPCYNEEACVGLFYDAVRPVLSALGAYEIIFADDGSRDGTLYKIKALRKSDENVRFLSFSRNFGKEAAIYAGLRAAEGDLVGLMDADLQDPPELLNDMYKAITEEGYDVAACRRTDRKGEPKLRSAFARLFYKIINAMSDAEVTDGARDFRLMTKKVRDAVLSLSEKDRFSKGIFGWVGFKTKWLDYTNRDRVAGKTKWSFSGLTKYAVSGIEDFSTAPLKFNLALVLAFGLVFVGLVAADIVLAVVSTVPALLLVFTFVDLGFCLLAAGLAVISEYIAKMHREIKNRPVYIIRETERDE